MIKEAYVSFEVARLLKEKGFNELCNRVYEGPNLKYTTIPISPLMSLGELKVELGGFDPKQLYVTNDELGDIVYAAPTHQMAMKWLREVYNIDICIFPEHYDYILWGYNSKIYKNKDLTFTLTNAKSYEEAIEAALKYSLENLI